MIFAVLLLGIPQAKYSSQFSIPFVGMQRIAIDIKSSNKARLQVKGILNIDDSVSFTYDKTGNLGFCLSDQTIKKINNLNCEIHTAEYNHNEDTAYITVKVPYFINKKIKLSRY